MLKRGNKRGQVTIFIIIAIVIVALGILTWLLWPQISSAFMSESQAMAFLAGQAGAMKDNVQYCVRVVSEDILTQMGTHAGYYDYADLYSLDYAGPKVVVMYKNSASERVNKLPSLQAMSGEFNKALEDGGYAKIDKCLDDFKSYKKKMTVEPGTRKISAEINDENVLIKVEWPITLKKARATTILNPGNVVLDIPLGKIWGVANDIVESEVHQTSFEGIVWDEYIYDNPITLKEISISKGALNSKQRAIMLGRITNEGESPFVFNFGIDEL